MPELITCIALVVFGGILCLIGAIWRDIIAAYAKLYRHARKSPRFGVRTGFVIVNAAAVTCAIVRIFATRFVEINVFLALVALSLSIAVALSLDMFVLDLQELWCRRSRQQDGLEGQLKLAGAEHGRSPVRNPSRRLRSQQPSQRPQTNPPTCGQQGSVQNSPCQIVIDLRPEGAGKRGADSGPG